MLTIQSPDQTKPLRVLTNKEKKEKVEDHIVPLLYKAAHDHNVVLYLMFKLIIL